MRLMKAEGRRQKARNGNKWSNAAGAIAEFGGIRQKERCRIAGAVESAGNYVWMNPAMSECE